MATTKATELSVSAGCWKPLGTLQAPCLRLGGRAGWFVSFFQEISLHFYCYLLGLDTSQDTPAGPAEPGGSRAGRCPPAASPASPGMEFGSRLEGASPHQPISDPTEITQAEAPLPLSSRLTRSLRRQPRRNSAFREIRLGAGTSNGLEERVWKGTMSPTLCIPKEQEVGRIPH